MTMFDTVSAARAPGAGTAPAVPRPGTATTAPRPGARPRTVAVVGSGVAGLTAAYRLSRAGVEVELFEADDRLGGHAHTQEALDRDGRAVPLDTGFLVHNERTYPHLVSLFAELGVRTRDSEMSMSVRCDGCGLEYAGARGPAGLFARPDVLVRGRYLRLLAEVPRFHRLARRLLADPAAGEPSLREFLAAGRFGPYFVSHFMTPLVSSVWSCAPDLAGDYPARYLFAFLRNHGLLGVGGSPTWRTVVGGSRTYVDRIAERIATVHRSAPVRAVRRHSDGVTVVCADGRGTETDAVVVATHADQALRLLADPSDDEREVLGAFSYSRNPTVLHRDPGVLPGARSARGSWNYRMPSCTAPSDRVRVSYHLNRLLRLDTEADYLVTLNEDRQRPIPEHLVLSRTVYEHPVYTARTVAAQRRLPQLATARTVFAGAYHGWGFHEDGCRSGIEAAHALLGVSVP
ncbi:NAD(P)/FAD-dependent oxidoreductase [Kitasatospora purpeofusca]|uniref:NAD(P)/FAD-dependent oxidoreductase n=1 Tax=Kitasatospora purpeofusca TaxID=67352 RepID=UPI00224E3A38|nr:FAD-dependent oxidoreductase [Kitasatospora purpeofusca]MCX4755222.1 FAD-dependent oxidoreductase [Kitasatospora purpeofusca]WSR36896.1 FAD-dependent oxidoreductase [Kitasatospora purpeofusca]